MREARWLLWGAARRPYRAEAPGCCWVGACDSATLAKREADWGAPPRDPWRFLSDGTGFEADPYSTGTRLADVWCAEPEPRAVPGMAGSGCRFCPLKNCWRFRCHWPRRAALADDCAGTDPGAPMREGAGTLPCCAVNCPVAAGCAAEWCWCPCRCGALLGSGAAGLLSSPNAMLDWLCRPHLDMVRVFSWALVSRWQAAQVGQAPSAKWEPWRVPAGLWHSEQAAAKSHPYFQLLDFCTAYRLCFTAGQLTEPLCSTPQSTTSASTMAAAVPAPAAAAGPLGAAHHSMILILDFGSQYSHLIARRVRGEQQLSTSATHSFL